MYLPEDGLTKYAIRPNGRPRTLESCLKKIEAYSGLEENRRLILAYDKQCNANGNKTKLFGDALTGH